MHLFLFVDVQLLIFLIWTAIPTSKFPWFIVPLIAGSIALGIHYKFKVEPPRPAGKSPQQEEKGENQDPNSNQPTEEAVSRTSLDQVSLNE